MRRSAARSPAVDIIDNITVVPFDEACAGNFGRIASGLVEKGTPIGEFDAMIAAHALALGVTLVTNNVKHFSRVPGLKLANWV